MREYPSNSLTFPDAQTETLVLYLISKCFISASFLIIYPYAGELYPTELRGVGIGTSAYIGGLGLIIIPFINYLVRRPDRSVNYCVYRSSFIEITFYWFNVAGRSNICLDIFQSNVKVHQSISTFTFI